MLKETCVFCGIVKKSIPADVVAENEHIIVIKDIAPKAPIHYLIIPKIHVKDIVALADHDVKVTNALFSMVKELASNLSGSQSFRCIVNTGKDAGQTVFHFHAHFLSGKKMLDF